MDEKNLSLLSPEDLPITDEVKEKVKVNNLQENFIFLLNKKGCSLAEVQKETCIAWGTIYSWFIGDVRAQMLDINVKELADFFDVTVDVLAFGDLANGKEES
jgi:hypothetical protein